ncbi:alpha/beta hydrolase [Luteipulveratus flavus]|uniref:Alpha/beta hydrolase n=1 Tax=Luteipulveratus flavus TaxID=3031728 RepID=A0ABT6C6C3_9MICO|nr:alpha/beta hydrolase [Luteipulveratus sp. YIM 133296]MDF8263897.1 alpha/beta hydrolase [Luteipulveratus sp. YIM 133296]
MKKLFTSLAATALVGGSLVGATTAQAATSAAPVTTQRATPQGYQPPPVTWEKCTNPRLDAAGAQCGFVTVPLDYGNPGGTTIKLAVSRIKHKTSDDKAQGPMLVNPGGPGGSGLTLSRLGAFVPNGGGDPYDWIGFDPRGVGSSQPSLACDGNYFGYNRPDYRPFRADTEKVWLAKAKGYSDACAKSPGAVLLPHLKTTDSVQDMDSIRKALGAPKINFYGFSYGTYLGQVYSTLFPNRVGRMVLDGVVNPKDVWYKANLNQDVAFDKNIGIFFDWVARHDATYHLGTSGDAIKKKYYRVLNQLAKSPALGIIGPDEWTDAFLNAGYYVYGWEEDAQALAAAFNGDFAPTKELYDGANGSGPGSDNGYAVYLGVQCTDVQWPTSWNKWRADNWRTYNRAPFETWANAWFNAPCLTWHAKPAKKAVDVKGRTIPPILLIAETHDAATPFAGALEVRKRFPNARLVEGVGGTTHSGSLSGVACTDTTIATYLLTGQVPRRSAKQNVSDVKCNPVPAPDPAPTTSLRKSAAATGGDRLPADLRAAITGTATR